jgi:hypothetical protein
MLPFFLCFDAINPVVVVAVNPAVALLPPSIHWWSFFENED